jgi:hypothetical protein
MKPSRPSRWLGPLAAAVLLAPPGAAAVIPESAPLPDCVVPDLQGKTVPQLEYHRVLEGLRDGNPTHYCRLGVVKRRGASRPTRLRPLIVVSQTPRPGARVAYFTPISVDVTAARALRRPGPCHLVAGEETVARFPGLLVYRSFADTVTAGGAPFAQATWHTCRRPSGTRRTIFVSSDADGLDDRVAGPFASGGPYLAYITDAFESKYTDAHYARIVIRDVERGTEVLDYEIGHSFPDTPPVPDVSAIVVGPQAFAGWLTHDAAGTHVFARDSHGTRLVDQAAGTEITALRLRGALLTWTKNGVPETAPLA